MAVIVGLTLALSVPSVAAAADHTAVCSALQIVNRHAGHHVSGNKQGVSANLEGQSIDFCTPDGGLMDDIRASEAWVNIQGPSGVLSDIVQIGVGRCSDNTGFSQCNGATSHYWAWGRGSCGLPKVPTNVRLGAWACVTQNYTITHNAGFWNGKIANELRASVSDANICWTPNAAVWFSETWDYGDALGGSAGNKYAFTTLRMQNSINGAWVSPNLNPSNSCNLDPPGVFLCDIVSADSFQTWTDR